MSLAKKIKDLNKKGFELRNKSSMKNYLELTSKNISEKWINLRNCQKNSDATPSMSIIK